MKKAYIILIGTILIFSATACSKPKSGDINHDLTVVPTQPLMGTEEEIVEGDEPVTPEVTADVGTPTPVEKENLITPVITPVDDKAPSTAVNPDTDWIDEEAIIRNTNYVPGFRILKEYSFPVSLEKWGEVYFIAASGEGEFSLDSLYMYLVDQDSNILYEFPSFYGNGSLFSGMRAVNFKDINHDGLKDLIVIGEYMRGVGPDGAKGYPVAGVYLQQQASFINLPDLDGELNDTGNNETIDMVVEYLKEIDIPLEQ